MSAQLVLSFFAAAERLDMPAMLDCMHEQCELTTLRSCTC